MGALEGLRVLDLTQQYPGPYCTLMLADLGAEVWKIEPPQGEPMRHQLPGVFDGANRNKLGITVNLKSEEGVDILLRLAEHADIVVEGFRPGVVDRLGVGYEAMRNRKAELVYCSISGFGQTGPYRDRVGHDINYVAVAGAAALSGDPEGPPAWPVGIPVADVAAGSFAAFSILAAVMSARRTGQGQYLDVSMTDVLTAYTAIRINEYLARDRPVKSDQIGRASFGVFQTSDSKLLALGVVEEKFWLSLCKALGFDDFAADLKLRTFTGRNLQWKLVRPRLTEAFLKRPLEEWLRVFEEFDVPATVVNSIDDALTDPQLNAREMFFEDSLGNIQVAFPVKFSQTPWTAHLPAPAIGEHNQQVLSIIGFTQQDVEAARARGSI
jgi:crotonobetainyl-CoA:carnitine CoA-transferase CaiB-like acyl-CoA transferase